VIARGWTARTTKDRAPTYAEHLKERVLPAVRDVEGYAGAMLMQRDDAPDAVEVVVITFWQSLDAIRGFAGTDVESAVVNDEAKSLLTDYDRRVRHYELVLRDVV